MSQNPYETHSAEVRMWLDCGPHGRLDLCRVTPTRVVAKVPRDIPPGLATLVVTVDGNAEEQRVNLPAGVSASKRTATALPIYAR